VANRPFSCLVVDAVLTSLSRFRAFDIDIDTPMYSTYRPTRLVQRSAKSVIVIVADDWLPGPEM
jgi:hypothetical protein